MESPKRAAIYIRVSTDMQAKEGESIPAQRARLTEWAKSHGYVIVAEYCDAGESARAADRPQFVQMLQDARQNPRPFDAILLWKWDRFARNVDDATIYKGLLRRQLGLDLISIGDPQTDGAVGVLLERILDVVAEFQSLVTSEHVKNTMSYLAREGRWLGKVPFGYNLDDQGRLMIKEDEAEAVRWAFTQVARREASVSSIAERFALGLMFPSTKKYKWSPQAIRVMLRNEVYLGRAIWNRRYMTIESASGISRKKKGHREESEWIVVEDAHPPIVDKNTFEAAQRVLNEIRAAAGRKPYGDYLFRGLVVCAKCGHHMVYYAPHNGSKPRLVCSQYFRIPSIACRPKNDITLEELLEAVEGEMRRILAGEIPPEIEIAPPRFAANRIEASLEAVRQRLQRLMDAYEEGAITLEEFKARRVHLDAEMSRLEAAKEEGAETENEKVLRVKAIREKIEKIFPTLFGEGNGVTVTERNAAFAEVIERITVSRQEGLIKILWREQLEGVTKER